MSLKSPSGKPAQPWTMDHLSRSSPKQPHMSACGLYGSKIVTMRQRGRHTALHQDLGWQSSDHPNVGSRIPNLIQNRVPQVVVYVKKTSEIVHGGQSLKISQRRQGTRGHFKQKNPLTSPGTCSQNAHQCTPPPPSLFTTLSYANWFASIPYAGTSIVGKVCTAY